jgi:hypothetical protein
MVLVRLGVMNSFLLGGASRVMFLVSDMLRFVKYGLYVFFAVVPCLRREGARAKGRLQYYFRGERGVLERVYDS